MAAARASSGVTGADGVAGGQVGVERAVMRIQKVSP